MSEPDPLDMPVDHHYRLNALGEPVKCKTLREWCENTEASLRDGVSLRVVKRERIGACEVSTVFLPLDATHGMGRMPILWESMVFTDAHNHAFNNHCTRCAG